MDLRGGAGPHTHAAPFLLVTLILSPRNRASSSFQPRPKPGDQPRPSRSQSGVRHTPPCPGPADPPSPSQSLGTRGGERGGLRAPPPPARRGCHERREPGEKFAPSRGAGPTAGAEQPGAHAAHGHPAQTRRQHRPRTRTRGGAPTAATHTQRHGRMRVPHRDPPQRRARVGTDPLGRSLCLREPAPLQPLRPAARGAREKLRGALGEPQPRPLRRPQAGPGRGCSRSARAPRHPPGRLRGRRLGTLPRGRRFSGRRAARPPLPAGAPPGPAPGRRRECRQSAGASPRAPPASPAGAAST